MIGSLTLTLLAPSLRDWGLAEALGQESRECSRLLLHRSLTLKKSASPHPNLGVLPVTTSCPHKSVKGQ